MAMSGNRKLTEMTMDDEQIDERDQLSNLPEFIIHHILSFLNLAESCRAGSLSRKFYRLWSTNPVLNFDPVYFPENTHMGFIEFVSSTMHRYLTDNIIIKKFKLEIEVLPNCRSPYTHMIDRWVKTAVMNHAEVLDLCILPFRWPEFDVCKHYTLPSFVLSAKSLKFLKLSNVEFPSNDNLSSIKLGSLEYLWLISVHVGDGSLLRHMISSCPLNVLKLSSCSGFISEINVSELCKLKKVYLCQDEYASCKVGLINLESSNLEEFQYYAAEEIAWPLRIVDPARLLNLRKLFISSAHVDDELMEMGFLILPLLENLTLHKCYGLMNPKISSLQLKKLGLEFCPTLEKVEIDAPKLESFFFHVLLDHMYPSIYLSECSAYCKAYALQGHHQAIETSFFAELRKFLVQSNVFDVLSLSLQLREVKFNVEGVPNMPLGQVPYNLGQLELCLSNTEPEKHAISTLIEGLLWSCHPNILSLPMSMKVGPTHLSNNLDVCKIVMEKLRSCAVAWRHPLKGVEVSVDAHDLYEKSVFIGFMKFRFNLSW